MQTMKTRTYTNVALTAIMILLAILALQPFVSISKAMAEDDEREVKSKRPASELGQTRIAESNKMIAESNREIAVAIREASQSQKEIAGALNRLSDFGGK